MTVEEKDILNELTQIAFDCYDWTGEFDRVAFQKEVSELFEIKRKDDSHEP